MNAAAKKPSTWKIVDAAGAEVSSIPLSKARAERIVRNLAKGLSARTDLKAVPS